MTIYSRTEYEMIRNIPGIYKVNAIRIYMNKKCLYSAFLPLCIKNWTAECEIVTVHFAYGLALCVFDKFHAQNKIKNICD